MPLLSHAPHPAWQRLADADPAAFFPHNLEYSCPARGNWNIVHTGMLVPEAHQIYVCASGCLRGVILTAAEMGETYRRRFSTVELLERDLLLTDNEQLLIDGVTDILEKLEKVQGLPPAVLLFTACFHHFIGTDLSYVYSKLRKRWPGIDFAECCMDPIRQSKSLKPEERLRLEIARLWPERSATPKRAVCFGSNLPLSADSEIQALCRSAGWELLDWTACQTYADFQQLGSASLYIWQHPHTFPAIRWLTENRQRRAIYLPQVWRSEELLQEFTGLAEELGLARPDFAPARERALKAWQELHRELGSLPITLDYTFTLEPFSLARLLIEQGFRLVRIYADAVSPEAREDFLWLQEHAPDIELWSAKHPDLRLSENRTLPGKSLALGQKAAYYTGTPYFVDIIDGAGITGWAGQERLARMISEAARSPKDTQSLIARKGWGGPWALED